MSQEDILSLWLQLTTEMISDNYSLVLDEFFDEGDHIPSHPTLPNPTLPCPVLSSSFSHLQRLVCGCN